MAYGRRAGGQADARGLLANVLINRDDEPWPMRRRI